MGKANALQRFLAGVGACRDAMLRWRTQWRLSRPYPLQMAEESLGDYGERLAAEYLRRCGYTLLERSMHTHYGEIDLIAAWGTQRVVFVEVKTRAVQRTNDGGPSDAVDDEKQRRITQSALVYMKRHGLLETPGRMDVIAVTFDPSTRRPIFRHFENAFEAVGQYQFFR
jgi:putative endonuclease